MSAYPNWIHILYVEDDQDHREMITYMLAIDNIEVIAVETIREAFNLAQTDHFDLYLLDYKFPEGSGLELCRSLHENAPQIPIVFYSACAFEKDKQAGAAAGAVAYLTKPYLGNLAKTVLKTIEQTKKPALECMGFPFAGFDRSFCSSHSPGCQTRQTIDFS